LYKNICAGGVFTLALIGAGLPAYAAGQDGGAWPAMRALGQDIPVNRDEWKRIRKPPSRNRHANRTEFLRFVRLLSQR